MSAFPRLPWPCQGLAAGVQTASASSLTLSPPGEKKLLLALQVRFYLSTGLFPGAQRHGCVCGVLHVGGGAAWGDLLCPRMLTGHNDEKKRVWTPRSLVYIPAGEQDGQTHRVSLASAPTSAPASAPPPCPLTEKNAPQWRLRETFWLLMKLAVPGVYFLDAFAFILLRRVPSEHEESIDSLHPTVEKPSKWNNCETC